MARQPAARLIDRPLDAELRKLRMLSLLMGGKVARMVERSAQAFLTADHGLARHIIESDDEVDLLEVKIDALCVRILARWHPVARDLRLVAMASKFVRDLERMGDLAVQIARACIDLGAERRLDRYQTLAKMAQLACSMLEEALGALLESNPGKARRAIELDVELDGLCKALMLELLDQMQDNPRNIRACVAAQGVALAFERIGDHTTNLAERVLFLVEGKAARTPSQPSSR